MSYNKLAIILCLVILGGCTWKAEEIIVFNDIDPTPVTDLNYVGIDSDEDTIIVTRSTRYDLESNVGNSGNSRYDFILVFEGDTSEFVPGFTRLLVDPANYQNGQFLRADFFGIAPAGTGSLGDLLNQEKTVISRTVIFHIETYPAESEIVEVTNENGFKTVRWKRYDKHNFEVYTLNIAIDNLTRTYTFDHPDDTVWVDSLYIMGSFRADLTVQTLDSASSATDTYQDEYLLDEISSKSDGLDVMVSWPASQYYGPFHQYRLEGDNIFYQSDQYEDTTAVVHDLAFGTSYPITVNYYNKQDFNTLTTSIYPGERSISWSEMRNYPQSGRTVYRSRANLSILNTPSVSGLRLPFSRNKFLSNDGITFYYENDQEIFIGNIDNGEVTQLIDFKEELPDYRVSYVKPSLSHDGSLLICNIGCASRGSSRLSYALYVLDAQTGEVLDKTDIIPHFRYNDVAFSANDDLVVTRVQLTNNIAIRQLQNGVLTDTVFMPDYKGSMVFPQSAPDLMYVMNNATATQHIINLYTQEVISDPFPLNGTQQYVAYLPAEDSFIFTGENMVHFVKRGAAAPYRSIDVFASGQGYYAVEDTLYSANGYKAYIGD
ncbi:MAG: hypothetical protein WBB45_02405 [Cyclobacteriaceae bacterium]